MAGPLLPIGLLVAGMLANARANQVVEKEREDRMRMERQRQAQLGDQADATLRAELEQQARPALEADKTQAVAQREAKYEQALPNAQTASYATTPSAPKEVSSELARQVVSAVRRGRQQGKALAKLGGTADANQQAGFGMMRGGQELNRIGGESRASSNILPLELQDANQKGEGWRTIGDIANLGSMAYGLYGMTTPPTNAAYQASLKNPLFSH